jgi:dTDP-4-dehydrorhamnose reductase
MMWLIAGSNGQIGRTATAFLKSQSIQFKSLSAQELDISDTNQVKTVVESLRPSYILNAAAWTDVDRAEIETDASFAINAIGPRNLAVAARSVSAQFIHISTDYVFDGVANSPISEITNFEPLNYYGKTKAAGDDYVHFEYAEGSFILRTSWVYSQYGKNFVKSILRKAITSEGEIFVVDDQVGQPTSATDFVQKMYELINGNVPKGTYNITNAGSVSWYGFAQEILRLCDLDPNRIKPMNSDSLNTLAQRPKYSVLSDRKLRAVGVEPMQEWSQAIHRSISMIHQKVEAEIDL